MTLPVPNLSCGECNFVNEPERVYCHSCGAKLDRSIIKKDDEDESKESNERLRKQVQRMTNPKRGVMAREIKSGCKALVCAALVAMAVLALREPAEVAPDNKETGMRLVGSEVADAVTSGQVRRLVFTEADMNGYLRSTVRPKPGSGMIPGVEFQRAFVQFQPGVCWFGVQQAAFGFPIYTRVAYKPVFQNGKLVPELQGGSLGRLAVPKILMQFGDFMFENLWKGLKRDESSLRKMTAVVLEKQRVMFVTAGGNPVGTQ